MIWSYIEYGAVWVAFAIAAMIFYSYIMGRRR
jgi:hypothetical protein